jgi:benzoyl-CoA reductase subunit C
MTEPRGADPAADVLARAKELVDDLALDAVRGWKQAHPAGLAVGHLPVWVPRPLLEAMGCLPVGLFGGGDEVEIVRGDSYFQSYICHLPRSAVELAVRGSLDALDAFVFPSTCDVIRNLGGVFSMLFRERPVVYLDLPHNADPLVGGRFFAAEMERLAAAFVARGASPLDDGPLRHAIADENRRRRAIGDLDLLRRREPWRVPASEAYLVVRAGALLPAVEHRELVERYLDAVREREARPYDNVRVVCGAFCEQPPLALIRALERAGCYLIDDDFQLGARLIEGEIELRDGESPLESIARAFLELGSATATRWGAEPEKGAALVERVRRAGADGVLFAAASFCDPALLDRPMLEAALDRAGIPHSSFKYAENTAQLGPIREQAGAFSDAVKLWGGATP